MIVWKIWLVDDQCYAGSILGGDLEFVTDYDARVHAYHMELHPLEYSIVRFEKYDV